jgi:O-antigen biosynthesis protein WbqP
VTCALDLALTLVMLAFLAGPMLLITLLIRITSRGPALYWSNRVGRWNRIFSMPKFRTMRVETPELPSHLIGEPSEYLTPLGAILRKTSFDELPQLLTVLEGDLSLVGPRPALPNQEDLVAMRTERGIHELVPGLTGWAQISGRDRLSISEKVKFDHEYLCRRSTWFDLKILAITAWKVVLAEDVRH